MRQEGSPQQNIPTPQQAPLAPEAVADRNKIQIVLALLASREVHPSWSDKEVRSVAMKEWTADPADPNSLAARCSDYLEDPAHAGDRADLDDPVSVKKLLEKIRQYRKSPLH